MRADVPRHRRFPRLDGEFEIKVGDAVRQFGDKFQISKSLDGRRYWRVR